MGEKINQMGRKQTEWEPMPKPLVIDSGAGATVLPSEWFVNHETRESADSAQGRYYLTADGTKIYNEGEKTLQMATLSKDFVRKMVFQVAAVSKALGSVSQMVRNGNRVIFDQDGNGNNTSYIQHKETGQCIPVKLENGVYVLELLVAPPASFTGRGY